jgi:O-antigen/teichoic acid export membrane protein
MRELVNWAPAGDEVADSTKPEAPRRGPAGIGRSGQPFFRNAYALLLNTGMSGALGLVYWVLAARHYNDPDVGRGSAAISALMMLTGLVSLNAAGTLNRFIPKTGRRTFAVVAWAYLLTSAVIAALAVVFLATLDWWGPAYDLLRAPDMQLWFVAAAVGASVLTIQDSVLTGLRAAVWVPVWTTAFAVAKIILLVVLAGSMPRSGVFFSWIIPMLIVMFPVNLLIFGWLLPRHVRTTTPAVDVTRAQIGRFFAADYLGALCLYATIFVVPVLVATRVEPHIYAYFFVAWTIATVMNLVGGNLATSLAVEGMYDAPGLAGNCRSALTRALGLLLVGAVGVSLAAPYTLGRLGPGYLDAAPLLQLVVFATLPSAVVDIYLGTLRARNKRMQIIWVQALRGVLVVGLVNVLMHYDQMFLTFGEPRITAVGVAVLLGQLVVMLAVLPGLGRLLGWRRSPASAATVPTTADELIRPLAADR